MRRLIIITNSGGEENFLPGIALDKQNYLDFFHLPEGGLWECNEIQCYNDNCSREVLSSYILSCRLTQTLDYVVLVFCGHGYTHEVYGQMFELSPDNEISLREIMQMMAYTRCLMIADSCRTIVRMEDGGQIFRDRLFTESREDERYKARCHDIYDERFKLMSRGSFCIGNAASFNQAANENNRGGLYSQVLLKTAKDIINQKRLEQRTPYYNSVSSFSYVHSLASEAVSRETFGRQLPTYHAPRCNQPPFVVVP